VKIFISVVILSIGLALVWSNRSCLRLSMSPDPSVLERLDVGDQPRDVAFLFGDLCTSCPSGDVMEQVQDEDFTWVFEEGTGDGEIRDFMETFQVMGLPIVDDGTVAEFLQMRARCAGTIEHWRKNYVFTVGPNGLDRASMKIFR